MTQATTSEDRAKDLAGRDPSDFLHPTYYMDFDNPEVAAYARGRAGDSADDMERAVNLFYAVRDEFRYSPYSLKIGEEFYRASYTLAAKEGWCVPKGVLMAACARAVGVPARLGYADVENHLSTPHLRELMGSNLFTYHGYVELWLNGKWVKVTPVFNIDLCNKFHVLPQEFDGTEDALFQPYDANGRDHMEYKRDRGIYEDMPYEEIMADFRARYPKYMASLEAGQKADFAAEASLESKSV